MKNFFTHRFKLLLLPYKHKAACLVFLFSCIFEVVVSLPASAQTIAVENADKFPALNEMVFSYIQNPWRRKNADGTYTPYNENHNIVKLRIKNTGSKTLVISKFTFSNTAVWKITLPSALPLSISPGSTKETSIEFKARDLATRVKVLHDKLTISSNDPAAPTKTVLLNGLWQRTGEGDREPWAREIIDAFGYTSNTGYDYNDGTIDGKTVVPNSDEIISPFFVRANTSLPVKVIQMAAYHGCCASTESFKWYSKGSTTLNTIFTHNALDGQSLLPRKRGSTTELAQGTFSPSSSFGIKLGTSYSDRTRNSQGKIGIRIWKVYDRNGNLVPNAYIMGMDYLGTEAVNYDYNDNLYYLSNVKPDGTASSSELVSTPSSVDFGTVKSGSSKTLSVSLKNLGKSGDPSLKITSVQLSGANASEFRAVLPSTTTLGPQSSTSMSVSFRPSSRGIKNTSLLVYYSTASVPLRIPLYGVANDRSYNVAVVKRIKGGADASITIAGKVWESDKNYRKGSIKLDSQVQPGPISATDQDLLYQTYLSAATNLAETREEIPLSNGSYYVRLHFAENYFASTNSRVFNISIEGQTRLTGFDIHKEVGYRSALVKDFATSVSDGILTLKFNPTVNRVALCGIEIFKVSSASAASEATITQLDSEFLFQSKQVIRQLQVYPNPNQGDEIAIEATNFTKQEMVTLTLLDVLGQVIQVKTLEADDQRSVTTQMSFTQRLKPGVYIFRGQAVSGETQAKIIVE